MKNKLNEILNYKKEFVRKRKRIIPQSSLIKSLKKISIGNFILSSSIISLILEMQPLRSAGSLFTTNNATYLILISSIVLSYKTLLKIVNSYCVVV